LYTIGTRTQVLVLYKWNPGYRAWFYINVPGNMAMFYTNGTEDIGPGSIQCEQGYRALFYRNRNQDSMVVYTSTTCE
jgi:hypothetical protein